MSENNIIHRDLKLNNILIKYENNEKTKFTVKLMDYAQNWQLISLTKKCKRHNDTILTMAPEILSEKEYNNKCDLWSLGIIIYQLYFKKYPYNAQTEYSLFTQIEKYGQKMFQKTEDIKLDNLISQLLVKEPNERLSWEQYFIHPFFNNSS